MALSGTAKTRSGALVQKLLRVARSYIGGWRALMLLAVLAVSAGAALNWSWLVAAGVAPALLAALPCIAMCGLGLCANKLTPGSCSAHPSPTSAALTDTTPTVVGLHPRTPRLALKTPHLNKSGAIDMRKHIGTTTLVAAFLLTVAAATAINAHRSSAAIMGGFASVMRGGMGGGGDIMRGEMRGSGMMRRGGGMMGHCGSMMQGDGRGARPNDQWRNGAPSAPNKGE